MVQFTLRDLDNNCIIIIHIHQRKCMILLLIHDVYRTNIKEDEYIYG